MKYIKNNLNYADFDGGRSEMGFESYNFSIRIEDTVKLSQIRDIFLSEGYVILDSNCFEKHLKSGFIEVLITDGIISLRTAKTNDRKVIFEIFNTLKELNAAHQISIFDLQTKQEILLENIDPVLDSFCLLRDNFIQLFPDINYPIRCDEVFSADFRKRIETI